MSNDRHYAPVDDLDVRTQHHISSSPTPSSPPTSILTLVLRFPQFYPLGPSSGKSTQGGSLEDFEASLGTDKKRRRSERDDDRHHKDKKDKHHKHKDKHHKHKDKGKDREKRHKDKEDELGEESHRMSSARDDDLVDRISSLKEDELQAESTAKRVIPHDPALDLVNMDWMTSPPPPSSWRKAPESAPEPLTKAPTKPSLELNPQINPDSKLKLDEQASIGDGGASWTRTTGYDPNFRAQRADRPVVQSGVSRWKKEEAREAPRPPPDAGPRVISTGPSTSSGPSDYAELMDVDLNVLKSQIMRAKLQKKMDLVMELEAKLDRARKVQSGEVIDALPSHVRVIDDLDAHGRSRSATSGALVGKLSSQTTGKDANPRTSGLHSASGERLKYFADDDDVDLDTMVARERLDKRTAVSGSISSMDAHYADNVMRARNYKEDSLFERNFDGEGDVDYAQFESREKKLSQAELATRERSRAINSAQKLDKATSQCFYCLKTKKIPAHAILAMGFHTTLIVPFERGQLMNGHVAIVPHEHVASSTHMEDAVWSEVWQFMKALTKYFDSIGYVALFSENVPNLNQYRHAVIECYPVPKRDAKVAPDFFKKAIQETTNDVEWTATHQRVHEFTCPAKTIRNTIPQHFAYFMVQFGVTGGLAHHIEAKEEFPNNFAKQVIGGLLQLDETLYNGKHPRRLSYDDEERIARQFKRDWKEFDWTLSLK